MMGATNPTRAGSVAQRSGAPAHSFHHFRAGDVIYRSHPLYLFFTLSLAPGPFGADKIVARPACLRQRAGGTGSVVLGRSSPRTGKALILHGSIVLLRNPTRDACARVRACACVRDYQNSRTRELNQENGRNKPFLGSEPVLCRFSGSCANKIGGGYRSFGRIVAGQANSQCYGGATRRNFWDRNAGHHAWRIAGRPDLGGIGRAGKNGGFLRVFGALIGHVGMAMSECHAQDAVKSGLSGDGHKLSRLSHRRDLGGAGRAIGMGGQIAQAEGVGPPTPARPNSRMLAHAAFRISIDLLFYRMIATGLDWAGRSRLGVKMGSGDSLPSVPRWLEVRSTLNLGDETRVGDGGGPGAWSPLGEAWKLWGGRGHVNA